MKVDPTRRSGTANVRRSDSSDKKVSENFAKLLKAEAPLESASGTNAAPAVDALLSIQEFSDSKTGQNRNAQNRAELILERLEEIRTGLLVGGIPRSQLSELAQAVRKDRESYIDPLLAEVLDDIELRAMVELAKYDRDAE